MNEITPIRQGALMRPGERPVANWDDMIGAFLNTLDRKSTRATYARTLRALPEALGGRGPLDVTANDLGAWKSDLLDRMEADEIAPNTAKRKIMAVRSFFRFAYILGQSIVGPDARRYALKAPNGDVQRPFLTLSESDETRLLETLGGDNRKMIAVMLYAGLRVSELCKLDVGDYYENGGGKRWLLVRKGKRGKTRKVPVGATLAGVLGEPTDGNGPLFPSRQTKSDGTRHYTRVRLWQILRAALDEVWPDKRKDFSPHSLRHSAAMRWLRDGVPLTVIRDWLGHASLDTTKIYLDHLNDDEKHRLMR